MYVMPKPVIAMLLKTNNTTVRVRTYSASRFLHIILYVCMSTLKFVAGGVITNCCQVHVTQLKSIHSQYSHCSLSLSLSHSLTADESSKISSLTDLTSRGGEGKVSGELMVIVVSHGITILGSSLQCIISLSTHCEQYTFLMYVCVYLRMSHTFVHLHS